MHRRRERKSTRFTVLSHECLRHFNLVFSRSHVQPFHSPIAARGQNGTNICGRSMRVSSKMDPAKWMDLYFNLYFHFLRIEGAWVSRYVEILPEYPEMPYIFELENDGEQSFQESWFWYTAWPRRLWRICGQRPRPPQVSIAPCHLRRDGCM